MRPCRLRLQPGSVRVRLLLHAAGPALVVAVAGLGTGLAVGGAGRTPLLVLSGFALLLGGLSALSALRFGAGFCTALRRLTREAQGLARGRGEGSGALCGADEVARLQQAFERMALRVEASHRESEEFNRSLKAKVRQKTTELRRKNLALAFQNEKVIEADRLKSAFFANVSHELRTPLNAILALTEMLRDEVPGPVNAEQRKHLSLTYTSGENLLNLINEVLDLSRIEAGRMEMRPERAPIVDRLLRAVEELRPLAEEKRLTLTVEAQGAGEEVWLDADKVRMVFVNLLGNAIKFTECGSVSVRVDLLGEEGMLSVEVEDSGPGIAPEDQKEIFLEFHRLEHGAGQRTKGTGLGLAIGKKMVNLMGGDIWVDSALGKGSRFAFVVPISSAPRSAGRRSVETMPKADASAPAEAPARLTEQRILIVAEDLVAAGVFGRYFRQRGAEVSTAIDEREARRVLRSEQVALLLLDLPLAGDGARRLLQGLAQGEASAPPIVVRSVEPLDEEQKAFLTEHALLVVEGDEHGVPDLVERVLQVIRGEWEEFAADDGVGFEGPATREVA